MCVLGREAVELEDDSNGHRREKLSHEMRLTQLGKMGLERREKNGNEIRIKIIKE